MKKILLTIVALLAFIPVHADTIDALSPFTSTTSPSAAITQRTPNKAILLTGLSDGCLSLSSKIITSSGSPCGSGGGGSSTFGTTSISAVFPIKWNTSTAQITFGGLSTSTPAVTGNVPYFTGVNTFGNEATGTITCSGTVTCGAGSYVLGNNIVLAGTGGFATTTWVYNPTTDVLSPATSTTGILIYGSSTISALTTINGTTTNATSTNIFVGNLISNPVLGSYKFSSTESLIKAAYSDVAFGTASGGTGIGTATIFSGSAGAGGASVGIYGGQDATVQLDKNGIFAWESGPNPVGANADAGLSRLSPDSIAIGNGTQGDSTGSITASSTFAMHATTTDQYITGLAAPAGAFLAISPTGLVISTSTPSGGGGITALTGDGTASGSGSVALTLATVNSNIGSFGGANSIPSFTVNAKGLVTAASVNTPSIPASEVTSGTFGSGNYIFPAQLQVNSSTTLQNFTYLNATGTSATTTNLAILSLGTSAGTFLAVNPNGTVIATTTPTSSVTSGTSLPVKYATTGALPANNYISGVITEIGNGALSVDGASPAVGDRVLVKNEATAANNGIYTVTATGSGIAVFVLTRATDYNSSSNVYPGIATYVISGSTLADDWWAMTSAAPITVGTTALNYTESSAGALVPGTGISISGTTISVNQTFTPTWSGLHTFTGGILGVNATSTITNLVMVNSSTTYSTTTNLVSTNATSTNTTVKNLATAAGTFVAADPTGNLIATSTPAAPTYYYKSYIARSILPSSGISGLNATTSSTAYMGMVDFPQGEQVLRVTGMIVQNPVGNTAATMQVGLYDLLGALLLNGTSTALGTVVQGSTEHSVTATLGSSKIIPPGEYIEAISVSTGNANTFISAWNTQAVESNPSSGFASTSFPMNGTYPITSGFIPNSIVIPNISTSTNTTVGLLRYDSQ